MENVLPTIEGMVNSVNDFLWGYILMYALVGIGIFFTIYLGAPQFIRFGPACRQVFGRLYKGAKPPGSDGENSISSFQALAVAISAQVGTGNVAGVATAIVAGGPGAIFWMWVSAMFGMATIFSEAILAQHYREDVKGQFVGGPAFYISKGLKHILGPHTANFLAYFFSIAIIVALGFIGCMVQSNSIASSINSAFGFNPLYIGILIAIVAGLIFIGGIQRIALFAQLVVPFMAVLYIACAIIILFEFSDQILPTIQYIFQGAFNPEAIGGGVLGVSMKEAIRYGVARGLFSNEAGMGSTPHAHATALVLHPVLQGFVAFIGVFFDTVIVCSATALIILLTNSHELGLSGALVTQEAFSTAFGSIGPAIIALCLTFFAFTTVIGWYYFGESNIRFLFKQKSAAIPVYRILVLLFIVLGATGKVDLVWNLSDMFNGIMVIPNLIALILLRKEIKSILKHYDESRQDGPPSYEYPELNK